ncbi:hypothetical protein V6667_04880 [Neisseria leonii]|uniref:Uncharacterized protein n=1 Tax=Neisseria leonii TaxID=2995413 RepID=A0A9X4I9Y3_9NEIS|nr:hypothetical protein [Neisseria sp. 51.81]MDD9326814.1 hypothetical protein [Neisseria sp. 51.81]
MTHVISLRFKNSLLPCGAESKVAKRGIIMLFIPAAQAACDFPTARTKTVWLRHFFAFIMAAFEMPE